MDGEEELSNPVRNVSAHILLNFGLTKSIGATHLSYSPIIVLSSQLGYVWNRSKAVREKRLLLV